MAEQKNRLKIVEELLERVVERNDFPAFAEHISEVMDCVEDQEISVRHITNLILKDFGLTLKVLRTANSPYYNRSGKGVITVTHAVALLGLEAIRDLAGGVLLFRHFGQKSSGLRELMLLSLLTASHARVVATRVKYPRIEEAYLCGMFRNLGEVLAAGYLPRKYAAILARMKGGSVSEQAACLLELNCTYEELGRAAARFWKMPERVRQCMRSEQPRLTKPLSSELELLQALTSFSHGLTETVHRRDPKATKSRLNYLLMSHGPVLSLARDEIQEIADEAIDETKSTFESLRIPLDDLRLRKQTETALAQLECDPEAALDDKSLAELPPGALLLSKLADEVQLLLDSDDSWDLTKTILMILEAIYRAAPVNRIAFGLVSPDHSNVRARLGLGPDIDRLLESFRFPLSIRSGAIAVALLGKQDLYVHDDRFADSEFGALVGSRNFGLLPVVVDRVVVGCLYFDRSDEADPPDKEVIKLIGRLRDMAAAAIRLAREQESVSV